jgi:hypothetical protein
MNSVVLIKNVPRVSKKTTNGSLLEGDVGEGKANDPSVEAGKLDVEEPVREGLETVGDPGTADLLAAGLNTTRAHASAPDRVYRGD